MYFIMYSGTTNRIGHHEYVKFRTLIGLQWCRVASEDMHKRVGGKEPLECSSDDGNRRKIFEESENIILIT